MIHIGSAEDILNIIKDYALDLRLDEMVFLFFVFLVFCTYQFSNVKSVTVGYGDLVYLYKHYASSSYPYPINLGLGLS